MRYSLFSLIQVIGIAVIFIIGCGYTSQWVAEQLRFASMLGSPLVGHFYNPFSIFTWNWDFGSAHPGIFRKAMFFVMLTSMLCLAYAFIITRFRAMMKKKSTAFGSARWMTDKEIRKSDLATGKGVFIGKKGDLYLQHDGAEHILAFAPTRSGKGVGLVVPTLLSWTGSVLVHDIKGENWQLTSGWRKEFSHSIYFNPTSDKSAKFNPLLEVRKGENEIRDVQNIADILVDPEGSTDKRDHWSKTGHALLVATILHTLYSEKDKTLSGVANFLSDPERNIRETFEVMMNTKHLGDRVHPVVASSVREMLNKSDNELSGVLSTTMSFLGLYRDPIVAAATSSSDFRINDLMNADNPVSLYLVVPPSDISRTKPLIRLILNQTGRLLTEKEIGAGTGTYKHRLLMMIDEFPMLGRLDFFESSLAYVAGYGIKCYLIAQSLNQLDKSYGQQNAILDNCHIRVAFASNDDRTAKRISDLLGQKTEIREVMSQSGNKMQVSLNNISVSQQESGRALLTPGEIGALPATDSIIFKAGSNPIYANKITYYNDPNFKDRVLPAPVLTVGKYYDVPNPSAIIPWSGSDFIKTAPVTDKVSEEDTIDEIEEETVFEALEEFEADSNEEGSYSEGDVKEYEGLVL